MNKHLLSIVAIAGAMTLFSTACKKKSSENPNLLIGTWTITAVAIDNNHNNIEDAGEILSLAGDTSAIHQLFTFNADGTLVFTYYTSIKNATWTYEHNNTYLKVMKDSAAPSYSKIEKLTAASMTIKDTSAGNAAWTVFTKQ